MSVVIPSPNERANIGPLLELLDAVLHTVSWEVIFVDDSPDCTSEYPRDWPARSASALRAADWAAVASRRPASKAHWRLPHPISPLWMPTMQHDEKLLPQMLAILKDEPVDLVVGSRYMVGGGIG